MNKSMTTRPGPRYLVLIPSYNAGRMALETVRAARETGEPVCVVIDGSTDGSREQLAHMAQSDPELTVLALAHNSGKGAAILHGLRDAVTRGFTHVLTMDSDGQHPAAMIPEFLATSHANPDALILGKPVFDHTAPIERIIGRKLSNWWVNAEDGGVSHYHYLRNNLLLTRRLLRLFCGFLLRLPLLLMRRFRSRAGAGNDMRAQ